MPTELKITLLVILALVVIYALIVFCIGIYLLGLHTTIKKKATLINSILAQQYDLIRLLRISIEEEKIELPENVYIHTELHHKTKMESKTATELMKIKEQRKLLPPHAPIFPMHKI